MEAEELGQPTTVIALHRPSRGIVLLVVAKALWTVFCALAAVRFARTASVFGLAQLVGEALFVGGLAVLEWVNRERLLIA